MTAIFFENNRIRRKVPMKVGRLHLFIAAIAAIAITLAGMWSLLPGSGQGDLERDDCGAFTIGQSAIGGCDRIGG